MQLTRFHHFIIGLTAIILFAASIFSYVSNSNAAFGTSPPWVKNDHMLPDTSFEQIVKLRRSDTDKEMQAEIRIEGDKKLLKWITIEDKDNLIMRTGQSMLPMKVTVDVPKRAELRSYKGHIYIKMLPVVSGGLGGGQVAITLGATISIDITVTGQAVLEYKVQSISVNPLTEGKPFSIRLAVANLGNVSVSEIEGKIDIYDENQKEILETLNFTSLNEEIAPDEVKISNMIFEDTVLDPGHYWAFVSSTLDGEVVYENRLPVAVQETIVPVITAEAVLADLPKMPGEGEGEEETPDVIEVPITEMKPAAPADSDTSNIFLIFGLAGLGFGLLAMFGVVVVLIFVLKNQQKGTQQVVAMPYAVPPAPAAPPAPTQPQPAPAPPTEPKEDNPPENGNMNTDAASKN